THTQTHYAGVTPGCRNRLRARAAALERLCSALLCSAQSTQWAARHWKENEKSKKDAHTQTHTHTRIYMYTHTSPHTHTQTQTQTHTHTHTHRREHPSLIVWLSGAVWWAGGPQNLCKCVRVCVCLWVCAC